MLQRILARFKNTSLFFWEGAIFDQMKPEIASADEIHDEIEIVSILETIEGVNQELVFQTL